MATYFHGEQIVPIGFMSFAVIATILFPIWIWLKRRWEAEQLHDAWFFLASVVLIPSIIGSAGMSLFLGYWTIVIAVSG